MASREDARRSRARTVAGFVARAPAAVPRIFAARCEVSTELARRLGLSDETSIFGKLEVTTRGAAALFAIEHGLL